MFGSRCAAPDAARGSGCTKSSRGLIPCKSDPASTVRSDCVRTTQTRATRKRIRVGVFNSWRPRAFWLPGVRTPVKQHNSRILYMTLSRISCRETPLPSSQLIALSPFPGCSRPSARRDDGAPPDAVARLRHRCSCRVGLRFIVGGGSGRGCKRGGPAGRWQ